MKYPNLRICSFPLRFVLIAAILVSSSAILPAADLSNSKWIEESGLTGGIVVALDFSDGKSIANLAIPGNFVVHGLLTTEPGLEEVRGAIKQAGLLRQDRAAFGAGARVWSGIRC